MKIEEMTLQRNGKSLRIGAKINFLLIANPLRMESFVIQSGEGPRMIKMKQILWASSSGYDGVNMKAGGRNLGREKEEDEVHIRVSEASLEEHISPILGSNQSGPNKNKY